MKKIFSVILVFIFTSVFAQLELKDSIILDQQPISELSTDELGNIYYIQSNKFLTKIEASKKSKSFSNQSILDHLNVQSSLLLTILSNHNQLILLDNQLNKIQDPIELYSNEYYINFPKVLDNNFLIGYDVFSNKLVQLNYQLNKIINTSPILTMINLDENIQNILILNKKIYLVTNQNLYEFDEFLSFRKKHAIPNQKITKSGRNLILQKEKTLYNFDTESNGLSEILQKDFFDDFTSNGRELFVQKDKVVYIYKLKN